ncbi:Non-reducing polyketide synthase gsfA [Dissostichus eleginoides]|uniref:Non-reducing polyketide synthase gsfA n=1 Tax=Dissostichus eleginoides TaxID=100907 RepID=A0AAD9BGA3_DISEL|nr:Non-reducing polyketide synthase gsfA [Dissostichus eleginoides]
MDSRDSAPSTLGLCCPMVPLSVQQRPPVTFWQTFCPFGVAPPEDSAPQVERPEEAPSSAPPSTSGLGFSTKRTWEEACREEDFRDSPTPTSGLGLSTKRTREEDFRNLTPSSSGPCPPLDKRYRPEDHRLPEDSDSD